MAPFYVDTKVGRLLIVCVRYKEFAYEFLGVDEKGIFRRIGASACKFVGFYDEEKNKD